MMTSSSDYLFLSNCEIQLCRTFWTVNAIFRTRGKLHQKRIALFDRSYRDRHYINDCFCYFLTKLMTLKWQQFQFVYRFYLYTLTRWIDLLHYCAIIGLLVDNLFGYNFLRTFTIFCSATLAPLPIWRQLLAVSLENHIVKAPAPGRPFII